MSASALGTAAQTNEPHCSVPDPESLVSARAVACKSPLDAQLARLATPPAVRDPQNPPAHESSSVDTPHPGRAASAAKSQTPWHQTPPGLPNRIPVGPPPARPAGETDWRPPAAARRD